MAFTHYSNLFTSGLLSEEMYPPAYFSHPWAMEDLGPRRGSLPGDVTSIVPIPSPPPTARTDSMAVSGESFYFTFKKRRNPVDYRSFLSLDLAESQSLRSASLKGRDGKSSEASSSRRRLRRGPTVSCYTSPTRSSFSAVQSPPAPLSRTLAGPSSPPRLSKLHVPTPLRPARHPLPPVPSVSSPSSRSSRSPPRLPPVETSGFKFPASSSLLSPTFHHPSSTKAKSPISPVSKGGISPIRFASPPPSPALETESIGPKSYTTSSVSSTFRKAQRVDALARLEGRGRSEDQGRRDRNAFPRMSQNFMSMSDDEDEDDEEIVDSQLQLEPVPETRGEDDQSERESDINVDLANAMYEENRFTDSQGLVVSIDAAALTLFELTPRTSTHAFAWSNLLDSPQPKLPKKKHASRTTLRAAADANPRSKSAMSHTNSHRTRTENHRSISQAETRSSKRHRSSHPPRLSLNLESGWAPVEVNFIDLRDEQQEDAQSSADSWRSIFEVSCSA